MTHSSFEKRDAWRDDGVAKSYDARRFGGWLGRRKQAHDERLVAALFERAGSPRRVLDVPCGTGRLLEVLAQRAAFVVGCDVSLEMLRAGRTSSRAVQGDCLRLPFRDRAFDAALCMRFLFHVGERELRVAMLREIARVAGLVVVQVRFRWTLKHGSRWLRSRVGAARRYRPSSDANDIARELADAGLELVELRPVSRVFSDKALVVARSRERTAAT